MAVMASGRVRNESIVGAVTNAIVGAVTGVSLPISWWLVTNEVSTGYINPAYWISKGTWAQTRSCFAEESVWSVLAGRPDSIELNRDEK